MHLHRVQVTEWQLVVQPLHVWVHLLVHRQRAAQRRHEALARRERRLGVKRHLADEWRVERWRGLKQAAGSQLRRQELERLCVQHDEVVHLHCASQELRGKKRGGRGTAKADTDHQLENGEEKQKKETKETQHERGGEVGSARKRRTQHEARCRDAHPT